MIKAETTKDGNTIKVTFDGETSILTLELPHIVTKGVTIMSGKFDANNVEATLYALMMTVIDDLNEEGYKVDHKKIGLAMMVASKPGSPTNEYAPQDAATSTGARNI